MVLKRSECDNLAEILGGVATVENGVCTVEVPRINPRLTIQGRPTNALFGIGTHFTFENPDRFGRTSNFGDVPVVEADVNPFISALRKRDIYVSAVHNQFIFDIPKIIYVHLQSVEDPFDFARKVAESIQVIRNF